MIIRDKQELRKCVKQCVRRAEVTETDAASGAVLGEYGIEAYLGNRATAAPSLQEAFEGACGGSPLACQPSALLAALDALQLPVHDLDKAECIVKGYDHDAYLAAVLDAMRARKVLVRTDADDAGALSDERLGRLVVAGRALFQPGRYGVDYESAARRLAQALRALNAADVAPDCFSESALRYCLIPVCEDEHAVLHVHAETEEQLLALFDMLAVHRGVRAVVSTDEALEPLLIRRAASARQILVQLRSVRSIPYALHMLGTRFIPYASCAQTPEDMLGGWIQAREALWQALYDAYLPLARAGYELTRERIEADVQMLLGGNYEMHHQTITYSE